MNRVNNALKKISFLSVPKLVQTTSSTLIYKSSSLKLVYIIKC